MPPHSDALVARANPDARVDALNSNALPGGSIRRPEVSADPRGVWNAKTRVWRPV